MTVCSSSPAAFFERCWTAVQSFANLWVMANIDLFEKARAALVFFVPFLFALCFHEFAHAWMARRRGDRTAEMLGRLTMNPAAHADPVGTIFLPLLALFTQLPIFGWAKPVPVNPRNLKRPRQDMFWIALAGPVSNLLLAGVAAIGLFVTVRAMPESLLSMDAINDTGVGRPSVVFKLITSFISVNVLLAIFNLIPIHPLDGGKVLARFLPERMNRGLEGIESYTSMGLMVFFVLGGFAYLAGPVQFITVQLLRFAGLPVG